VTSYQTSTNNKCNSNFKIPPRKS